MQKKGKLSFETCILLQRLCLYWCIAIIVKFIALWLLTVFVWLYSGAPLPKCLSPSREKVPK